MSESKQPDHIPPITRQQQLLAAVLVFTGALCFSAKAVFVKLAYRYEVDSISLLALRMLFSLPIFLFMVWWSSRRSQTAYSKPIKRDWLHILLVGVLGYYLASMFDFIGLQYIDASIERLILFIYPTIVLVISAVFLKQKIEPEQYGALILTYVGVALAFLCGREIGSSSNFYLGGGLIFLSALTYAVYLIGSGKLLPKFGTLQFTSYAMTAACAAVLLHHGLLYRWRLFHFAAPVYYLSILIALISTVLPAFMIAEGIRLIGAGNAAIISSVGPVSTVVLAYIFLGERLNNWQIVGGLLVIGGVLLITLRKHRTRA